MYYRRKRTRDREVTWLFALVALAAIAFLLLCSGCNTVAGAGRDLAILGEALSNMETHDD